MAKVCSRLTQGRLIYQLTIRAFFRAIVQYTDVRQNPALYEEEVDERSRRVLGELLFAYKVNPQTVFYLGYSDIGKADQDVDWWRSSRTVFIKIGYAWLL